MKPTNLAIFILVPLTAGPIGPAAQAGAENALIPDPAVADTVRVESFSVSLEYNSFWLDIYLYNDEELRSVVVPLKWNSPDISIDSVYFDWSRAEYINLKESAVDNENRRLFGAVEVAFEPPLEPGYGWFFSLFCRIDSGTTDQIITFDTALWPPEKRLELTLTNGLTIIPQFVRGEITLGEMPDSIIVRPDRNTYDAAVATSISITFPGDLLPASITDTGITVFGQFSGNMAGLLEYNEPSRTIKFNPVNQFYPGERITTIINSSLEISGGGPATTGYIFSFTASTAGGSGSFTHQNLALADLPGPGLSAADFDGDGNIDLAVPLPALNSISIMFNNGEATFPQTIATDAGLTPRLMATADLNRDGYPDVVAAGHDDDRLSILLNNRDGSLALPYIMYTPLAIGTLYAVEIDLDGILDLVSLEYDVDDNCFLSLYLGDGSGNLLFDTSYALGTKTGKLILEDTDNDHDIDGVFADADGIVAKLSNDNGRFTSNGSFNVDQPISDICSGDFNLDQAMDLALVSWDNILILINDGVGNFGSIGSYPVNQGEYKIAAADIDGDGDPDLAVFRLVNGAVTIFFNDGQGVFAMGGGHVPQSELNDHLMADFNNDGNIDIAAAVKESPEIVLFVNYSIYCGDANGDRLVNVGDIVYLSHYIFQGGSGPESLEAADPNCDGSINVGDIVFLVNYVFAPNSPNPCTYCD